MLTLVRGLPGSGKSTWAKENKHFDEVLLEADMFFVQPDGSYKFNGELLRFAHEWCINTARILMNNGIDVTVANTFTTVKEMRPYIEHAEKLGYKPYVYRMTGNYGSIHDVPEEAMERMKARFVDYEGEILV